jgi:hypothetical protein
VVSFRGRAALVGLEPGMALTYHNEIGGASISFTEFANADPTERSQFNMEEIGAAEMMWNGFKNCKSRILMRVAKNPERRYVESFSFPQRFCSRYATVERHIGLHYRIVL